MTISQFPATVSDPPSQVSDEVRAFSDAELLARIFSNDRGLQLGIRTSLILAIDQGELLWELRKRTSRGHWLQLVHTFGDRGGPSYRTVMSYIQVFERRVEIEAKLQSDASFSFSDALKFFAVPRKPKEKRREQQLLFDTTLYTLPMITDWISQLDTLTLEQEVRSLEPLRQLRERIDHIVRRHSAEQMCA